MKVKKLKDYSSKREVIDDVSFCTKGTINKNSKDSFYIYVPNDIRNRLRLSVRNDYEFRVIICRKDIVGG